MTNDRNFCVYSQDKFMSNRKMWVKRNYLVINGMPRCTLQWLETKSSHNLKEICQAISIKFCSQKQQVSLKNQVLRLHTLR